MSNQISRVRISGIRTSVIDVKELRKEHSNNETDMDNIEIDFRFCEEKKLCDGHYHIVFRPS